MVTLEEYLDRKNPDIDNANIIEGPTTSNAKYSNVSGFERWTEFNYQTLKELYGLVLDQELETVPHDPIPEQLETEIWDERHLEFVISEHILRPVRFALKLAYRYCAESWSNNAPHEFDSPIDPGPGARSKRSTVNYDSRFRADWSLVRKGHMTSTQPSSYVNYCPGDTKLAKKWKSEWCIGKFDKWEHPVEQIQTYSGDHWNVRYGWLISEEECSVFLITRETIGPGLATSKESRQSAQSHARVASGDTELSSLMAPLSISYKEEHPNVEYQPIRVMSIPWNEFGRGRMNVKKGLFFLLMLAGAPGRPKSVQTGYPPIDSWWHENGMYRHKSSGRLEKKLRPTDILYDPLGPGQQDPQPSSSIRSRDEAEGEKAGNGKRRKIEGKGKR